MRKLFVGFLVGVIAAGSGSVLAETVVDNAKIYLGRTKLMINGVASKSETLLYKDVMYIPVSEAARQLGCSAFYDAPSNTTWIAQPLTATVAPPAAPARENWALGETMTFTDGTRVRVTGLTEMADYWIPGAAGYRPNPGYKFVKVDFSVRTDAKPANGAYFDPLDFVKRVMTVNKVESYVASVLGEAPQILPGEWYDDASVFFEVPENDKVAQVAVQSGDGWETFFVGR